MGTFRCVTIVIYFVLALSFCVRVPRERTSLSPITLVCFKSRGSIQHEHGGYLRMDGSSHVQVLSCQTFHLNLLARRPVCDPPGSSVTETPVSSRLPKNHCLEFTSLLRSTVQIHKRIYLKNANCFIVFIPKIK